VLLTNEEETCEEIKLSKVLKIHRSRHDITSEQLAAQNTAEAGFAQGDANVLIWPKSFTSWIQANLKTAREAR
jgi:hypothetical protein